MATDKYHVDLKTSVSICGQLVLPDLSGKTYDAPDGGLVVEKSPMATMKQLDDLLIGDGSQGEF